MAAGDRKGLFDRFAGASADFVSRAPFFVFCVFLVVAWLPTYPIVRSFDTWQLLINTPTTILTFLLVAVLQNSQRRIEDAVNEKLDALADGLADFMEFFLDEQQDEERAKLAGDIGELKQAVGLEKRT